MSGDDRWYIRIQGRVNGPYDLQHLRGLVQRGRLSRVHEVSPDGKAWSSAATLTELFESRRRPAAAVDDGPVLPGDAFVATVVEDWYFTLDGTQQGPISAADLRQRLASRQIPVDTPVWRAGLPEWLPARQVPELGGGGDGMSGERRGRRSSLIAVVLALLAGLGYGGFRLIRHRFADPLVVANIESASAAQQLKQAVGLVATGWRTIDKNGDQQDRDVLLGKFFDGPYRKLTDGDKTLFALIVPDDEVGLFDSEHLYRKEGDRYVQLEAGECVAVKGAQRGAMFYNLGATGTCFAVTADGYAITNRHVIEDVWKHRRTRERLSEIRAANDLETVEPAIWVFFDGKQYDAEIVHVSEGYDLAVLKVNDRRGALHFTLAATVDDDTLPRGHKVYALGFPGKATVALSDDERAARAIQKEIGKNKFKISSKFTTSDFEYSQADGSVGKISKRDQGGKFVQHNADINPGNSGGPLVTRDGVVFAINTLTIRDATGIHFSVAIDQLRDEIDRCIVPPPKWR